MEEKKIEEKKIEEKKIEEKKNEEKTKENIKEKTSEKDETGSTGSNCCVKDLSIDGGDDKENVEENLILNKSFDDIKNFSNKLTLKDNFENIFDDIFLDDKEPIEKSTRSKTIAILSKNIKYK